MVFFFAGVLGRCLSFSIFLKVGFSGVFFPRVWERGSLGSAVVDLSFVSEVAEAFSGLGRNLYKWFSRFLG